MQVEMDMNENYLRFNGALCLQEGAWVRAETAKTRLDHVLQYLASHTKEFGLYP